MPLTVDTPKTDADFLRMAESRGLAFASDYEYIDLLFLSFITLDGEALLHDRLLRMQRELPSVRLATVRDTATGEIVSQAEWHFYDADSKGDAMKGDDFLEGTDGQKEYGKYLILHNGQCLKVH